MLMMSNQPSTSKWTGSSQPSTSYSSETVCDSRIDLSQYKDYHQQVRRRRGRKPKNFAAICNQQDSNNVVNNSNGKKTSTRGRKKMNRLKQYHTKNCNKKKVDLSSTLYTPDLPYFTDDMLERLKNTLRSKVSSTKPPKPNLELVVDGMHFAAFNKSDDFEKYSVFEVNKIVNSLLDRKQLETSSGNKQRFTHVQPRKESHISMPSEIEPDLASTSSQSNDEFVNQFSYPKTDTLKRSSRGRILKMPRWITEGNLIPPDCIMDEDDENDEDYREEEEFVYERRSTQSNRTSVQSRQRTSENVSTSISPQNDISILKSNFTNKFKHEQHLNNNVKKAINSSIKVQQNPEIIQKSKQINGRKCGKVSIYSSPTPILLCLVENEKIREKYAEWYLQILNKIYDQLEKKVEQVKGYQNKSMLKLVTPGMVYGTRQSLFRMTKQAKTTGTNPFSNVSINQSSTGNKILYGSIPSNSILSKVYTLPRKSSEVESVGNPQGGSQIKILNPNIVWQDAKSPSTARTVIFKNAVSTSGQAKAPSQMRFFLVNSPNTSAAKSNTSNITLSKGGTFLSTDSSKGESKSFKVVYPSLKSSFQIANIKSKTSFTCTLNSSTVRQNPHLIDNGFIRVTNSNVETSSDTTQTDVTKKHEQLSSSSAFNSSTPSTIPTSSHNTNSSSTQIAGKRSFDSMDIDSDIETINISDSVTKENSPNISSVLRNSSSDNLASLLGQLIYVLYFQTELQIQSKIDISLIQNLIKPFLNLTFKRILKDILYTIRHVEVVRENLLKKYEDQISIQQKLIQRLNEIKPNSQMSNSKDNSAGTSPSDNNIKENVVGVLDDLIKKTETIQMTTLGQSKDSTCLLQAYREDDSSLNDISTKIKSILNEDINSDMIESLKQIIMKENKLVSSK